MKQRLLLSLLLICSVSSLAQTAASENIEQPIAKTRTPAYLFDLGFGLGTDYGGVLGMKFTYSPIPYIGVFAGAGWDLVGVGWTFGAIGRILPADIRHVARPYVKAMFGANAVTKVVGDTQYDKIFYGPTVGAGLELRFGGQKKHGLNLDLNVPFRPAAFYEQMDKMNDDPRVTDVSSPPAVGFSLGYHFGF